MYFYRSDNSTSQEILHFLNSRIISGSVFSTANESFNGHVTIRLEHSQVREKTDWIFFSVIKVFFFLCQVSTTFRFYNQVTFIMCVLAFLSSHNYTLFKFLILLPVKVLSYGIRWALVFVVYFCSVFSFLFLLALCGVCLYTSTIRTSLNSHNTKEKQKLPILDKNLQFLCLSVRKLERDGNGVCFLALHKQVRETMDCTGLNLNGLLQSKGLWIARDESTGWLLLVLFHMILFA